jgi:hypothetical protein
MDPRASSWGKAVDKSLWRRIGGMEWMEMERGSGSSPSGLDPRLPVSRLRLWKRGEERGSEILWRIPV